MGISVWKMGDDDEFAVDAAADAGASTTYPLEAGQIRKGGHIVIKNRPCKVVDVSTSKTGKHGHAKCHFVAIDIFTGKKLEDLCPATHNTLVPNVKREDYQVMDAEDGFEPGLPISLMEEETGEITDAYNLPDDADLCIQIREAFDSGADTFVTVIEAMGEAMIASVKTKQNE